MEYVITWSEGEEVCYRFVSEEDIQKYMEEDKEYIVAGVNRGWSNEKPQSKEVEKRKKFC
ncbi:MAG: hypothetical protein K6U74_06715 [Firmicutes bacterium]|nr:hypothetical protein [Bacillota bacterium]